MTSKIDSKALSNFITTPTLEQLPHNRHCPKCQANASAAGLFGFGTRAARIQ
jgi:hypothetical protein